MGQFIFFFFCDVSISVVFKNGNNRLRKGNRRCRFGCVSSPLSGHVPNNSDILKTVFFFFTRIDLPSTQNSRTCLATFFFSLLLSGRDPFNQNSDRSEREKWSTSKGGPVFSKLFRLDRTDPLSIGPKFPEILVEWIAPSVSSQISTGFVG